MRALLKLGTLATVEVVDASEVAGDALMFCQSAFAGRALVNLIANIPVCVTVPRNGRQAHVGDAVAAAHPFNDCLGLLARNCAIQIDMNHRTACELRLKSLLVRKRLIDRGDLVNRDMAAIGVVAVAAGALRYDIRIMFFIRKGKSVTGGFCGGRFEIV